MDNFLDKRYSEFSEADLISDPFFQNWILHPDEESEHFWKTFLLEHPEKKETVDHARLLILNLEFETDLPEESRIKFLFDEHLRSIQNNGQAKLIRFNTGLWKKIAGVAAIIAGIVLLTYFLFPSNSKQAETLVATNYGELKELTLPDSTHIVLNAHSQIRYKKDWAANEPREIWLEGEAFLMLSI